MPLIFGQSKLSFGQNREIHNLDPQPHRHGMLAPKPSAPRVTRCHLGKYWSRDFFQKEAESSKQGVGNPEPYLFSLPLSRSREIHPLDPQPNRHSMLVPRVCAPRVTR